jgi:hypothetical protein
MKSSETMKAREWLDANPNVTAINVNAYVAMIEHAEVARAETAREVVAWLRAHNRGSLKLAVVIELLAQWVEKTYGD